MAAQEFVELSVAVRIRLASPKHMEQEFITIAEAVRLTGQSDTELMRFLKDRMESGGFDIESITKKEQRGNRMMYLISKTFLLKEFTKEENFHEDVPHEAVAKEDVLLEAKNEMITILQGVIETKDKQMDGLSKKIDELIERDRETNFLLRGLQERIFALEGPKKEVSPEEKKDEAVKVEKQKPARQTSEKE